MSQETEVLQIWLWLAVRTSSFHCSRDTAGCHRYRSLYDSDIVARWAMLTDGY